MVSPGQRSFELAAIAEGVRPLQGLSIGRPGTVPSDESLIFAPVTAPFLIFASVTAFLFLICFAPTLFFGTPAA